MSLAGCGSQSTRTGDPTAHLPPIEAGDDPSVYEEDFARAEIMAVLTRYYREFNNRNWAGFASLFWPGATITTIYAPSGEEQRRVAASSVEQFVAEVSQDRAAPSIFSERMGHVEVRLSGNLAVAWAQYDARVGEPGAVARFSGYDAFTLIRHDGRWRITHLAFAAE